MDVLKRIPVIIAAVYLLTGLLLYIFQRNFIFFPTSKAAVPPKSGIKEIIIENIPADKRPTASDKSALASNSRQQAFSPDSYKIRVLAAEKEHNKKGLIYFGGNAESVLYTALELKDRFPGYNIYFMKYRGYSGASGVPGEKEIFSDALALYDYLADKYETISVMGRSLGTGVACWTASKRPIDRLVLVTPYDSIMNIAQARFPVYPMNILLKHKFDSNSYIRDCVKSVKSGIMAVMVTGDSVVPNSNTQALVAEFEKELSLLENQVLSAKKIDVKEKKTPEFTLKIISGADHDSLSDRPEYYEWLKEFFNE
jgi:dienelactone hydrolase